MSIMFAYRIFLRFFLCILFCTGLDSFSIKCSSTSSSCKAYSRTYCNFKKNCNFYSVLMISLIMLIFQKGNTNLFTVFCLYQISNSTIIINIYWLQNAKKWDFSSRPVTRFSSFIFRLWFYWNRCRITAI